MKTADVLIIGAGVIGASIANHLSEKGFKNIVVIDKSNKPGCGSTGKATGGFRAQFGSEINIRLSLLAREKLLNFKSETGIDPQFQQSGYLIIAKNESEISNLRSAIELQHKCGLNEVQEVNSEEIRKLNPYINMDGVIGGAFCHTDGFIAPLRILKGYSEASEKSGVNFEYDTDVINFKTTHNENRGVYINEVFTSKGNISVGVIINAAGAWAGLIAKMTGADIPVTPLKRQVEIIKEENILPDNMPMTVFVSDSFHFRTRDGKLLLLLPEKPETADEFDTSIEENWLNKVFTIANEQIPALKYCSIDKNNSWAGLYEMSPDEHILLGKATGFENFYLANGSSGHGVMHSPAIGQLLAEIIAEGKANTIDTYPIRPSRFIEDEPVKSIKIL